MSLTLLSSKRRTAEERRPEVLAAAIEEFAAVGYHAGSTESIARAAGISQPYVLRLFGTKKQLFLEAVNQVTTEIMDLWHRAAAETDPLLSPDDRLFAMGEYYNQTLRNPVGHRLVLQAYAASADPDIRASCHRALDLMHTFLTSRTGASPLAVQRFFAIGMMLTVAAAIGAPELAEHQAWARTFSVPIDPPQDS